MTTIKALPRYATWSRREVSFDIEQELKELSPGKNLRYQFFDHNNSTRTHSANAARVVVRDVAEALGLAVEFYPHEDLGQDDELRFWVSIRPGTPAWRTVHAVKEAKIGVRADELFDTLKTYLEEGRARELPISMYELVHQLKLADEAKSYRRVGAMLRELGYEKYVWGQMRANRWRKVDPAYSRSMASLAAADPLRPMVLDAICDIGSPREFYTSQVIHANEKMESVLKHQVGQRSLEIRIARILRDLGYHRTNKRWIDYSSLTD